MSGISILASELRLKVSSNDSSPAYLIDKLEAGTNIILTEQNDGNFETILIETDAADRDNHTGTQLASTISDFQATVSINTDVAANTAARHTHANKAELDLITDGDHDVRTDNPHSVTFTQAVAADAGTSISAAEAESLRDGSLVTLHQHNADDVHYNQVDGAKIDIQTSSDDVELALRDLDNNKLSKTGSVAMTGNLNLNSNLINNLATPVAGTDAVNKDYVDGFIQGIDWQDSVLDKDLNTPPGSPNVGDRYIVAAGATGAWTGNENKITEWDGSTWVFTTPNQGFTTQAEDESRNYNFNGTNWVTMGSIIDHGNLQGLGADHHTQYLNETRHDALPSDNPHSVTFSQAVAADAGTNITAAEAETLTNASNADALHTHNTANLTNGAGFITADPTLKVSSNDTTANYLENKIVAGQGVTLTTLNDGANETLQITVGAVGDLPAVQAVRNTVYNYVQNTFTTVPFNVTEVENKPLVVEHNNINTERIDIKETGLYQIEYYTDVIVANGGTSVDFKVDARVQKNGTTTINASQSHAGNHYSGSNIFSEDCNLSNAFVAELTAGDYVTLQARYISTVVPAQIINNTNIKMAVVKLQGIRGNTGPTGAGSNIIVQRDDITTGTTTSTLNFEGSAIASSVDEGANKTTVTINNKYRSMDFALVKDGNNPEVDVDKGGTYGTLSYFIFPGSTAAGGNPAFGKFAGRCNNAIKGTNVRIYDLTNAQVIAEVEFVGNVTQIKSAACANIPAAEAMFVVQGKVGTTGGGDRGYLSSFHLVW